MVGLLELTFSKCLLLRKFNLSLWKGTHHLQMVGKIRMKVMRREKVIPK